MVVAVEVARDPRLLSVGAAARVAGVHPNTVRRWCDRGQLPCVRGRPGGDRSIARPDLDAFLESSGPEADLAGPPLAAAVDHGAGLARRIALPRIVAEISDDLDLPTLFERVLDRSMAFFGADKAALWEVAEPPHPYRLAAQRGLGDAFARTMDHLLYGDRGALSRAFLSSQVRVISDPVGRGTTPELRRLLRREGVRTVCLVPIGYRDEPLGLLVLYHLSRRAWPREELDLVRAFAAQLATAIKNARLYASVRGLEARLRSIQDLTCRLNGIQDVRGIAEAIVAEVSALIQYDTVRVYRVDHAAGMCEPVAFRGTFLGLPDPSLDLLRVPVGKGLTGWAAEHAEPILTGDAACDDRSLMVGQDDGPESLLVVPMSYAERVRGLIVLSKNGRDQFTADDLTTISIFAGHAAQAIENAENFERTRRQQTELEYQLDSQRKLLEVNEQLLSTLDPHGVLEMIADSLKTVVAYDTLAIYRADHATGTRRALLARDLFAEVILDQVTPIFKGLTGWVIEHREPVLANDAHLDPRTSQISGTPFEPESMVIVPLQVNGEVVGTLNVGRIGGREAHFGQNEFELTKLFAGQASIALQNAETHRAVEVRADRDSLTGLRNHGAFQRELDNLIARGVTAPFGLLMLDLDSFKAYNDSLGHPAGDRLLRELANRMTAVTREADHVYRYGGDEFAVLLPGAGRAQAYEVAERIRHSVAGLDPEAAGVRVGISVGIACFPEEGRTRDDLVAGADAMLYLAKPSRPRQSSGSAPLIPDQLMASLHESVLGLLGRRDPADLLEAVVSRACSLMGIGHGYLDMVEADGSSIVCRVGSGMFADWVGRRSLPGEGLCGRVWQSGVALHVADYAAWEHRPADVRIEGAVVGVPLVVRSRVVGVLGLGSGSPERTFSEREVTILGRFAELTAIALDNAELYAAARREIDERRRTEERLSNEALYDRLTGLPNRDLLTDRLAHALARAERTGASNAVLLLDLDRFKLVNDSLGHAAGDRLLSAVAGRLSACLRPGDTVARFGGDEFVVLAEAVGSIEDAIVIAGRIDEALSDPFPLGDGDAYVTASTGIALAQPGRDDAASVLRNADVALYEAKSDVARRHAVFEPAMRDPAVERLSLEHDLRRGLERDELRLWFQPLVELATGRVVGHEALVRWQHPTRGMLLPASFVPLAEDTGLILAVGQWVLREACRQARRWRDEAATDENEARHVMSVNLSAREFAQPDLVPRIAAALAESQLPPSSIELEITERVVMSDAEPVIMRLHQLRGLGVRLVLDDFGTGFSSLSYLRRLPLDTIKVDRSFVASVVADPATRSIVRSVVSLGHDLGMSVTAEGIETDRQLAALRELGCDLAQGNLFAEAMSAERLGYLGLSRAGALAGPGPTA